MNYQIILYTTSTCENCNIIKRIFNLHGISFTEKNIESSKENEVELMTLTDGKKIIPTIKIHEAVYINIKPHEILALINHIKNKNHND